MSFLLILVLFLIILTIPIGIFLGLLGLAFKGIGWALLFILKYMLPGAALGLLVTYLLSKKNDMCYDGVDYAKGAGIGVGVFFILFLVWLRAIPVDLKAPELEDIARITVSHGEGEYFELEETVNPNLIERIYDDIYDQEYHRSISELRAVDEDDGSELHIEMFDHNGNSLEKFTFYSAKCLRKGNFWYQPKKDYYLHRDVYLDVLFDARKERAYEKWQPFVDELFGSVEYDLKNGEIAFTIPEDIPDTTGDRYYISLEIIGMLDCTDRDTYQAHRYEIYTAEQKDSSWEPNMTYLLQEINSSLWEKITISFSAGYVKEEFDCITLLPEKLIK